MSERKGYMSESRDAGILGKFRFFKSHEMKLFFLFIAVLSLFAVSGCGPEQRAVDLYVDAVMLREIDENKMAVEKLNTVVEMNGKFTLAHSMLGEIYEQMEEYEKSAASYENATKLNPWSFKDYFGLGRVYQIMERFADAVRAYVRACEIKPNHFEAHLNAAKSCYEIEDYNNTLVYGKRALEIDPNVGELQKVLGDVYELQKDHEQAIRSYKRALELDSDNTQIMVALAVAYLRSNQNEPARELLKTVTEAEPDNNAAHQYLGYCYLRFNSKATASYKQVLETDRENVVLLTSLKEEADQALENAINSYNRAMAINERDWEAYRGLGVAYMLRALSEQNKLLKAKAIYQWRLSLEINPDQPRRDKLQSLIDKYSQ